MIVELSKEVMGDIVNHSETNISNNIISYLCFLVLKSPSLDNNQKLRTKHLLSIAAATHVIF